MQTMHVQPGRWRGCFVVACEGLEGDSPSPRMARFARVSSPSDPSIVSFSILALLFLEAAACFHKLSLVVTLS